MAVELVKWSQAMRRELAHICNTVDRSFLPNSMPYPYTEEDAGEWLEMVEEHNGVDAIYCAIAVDDKICGSISVRQKDDICRKDGNIGYMLLTEYWEKGIATEAVRLICENAFAELDIVRITAEVFSPNIGSQRVLEKNGFVLEGTQLKAIYKDGKFYDRHLLGKLKDE